MWPRRGRRRSARPIIDLLEIVDQLEEAVIAGRRSRVGGGWIVDRQQLLDLIDRIRTSAPASVTQAQQLLQERQKLLRQAQEEAAIITNQAQQEVELRVASHEIVLAAQTRADDILERAGQRARDLTDKAQAEAAAVRGQAASEAVSQTTQADRYTLEILSRLSEQLRSLDAAVSGSLDEMRAKLDQAQQSADLESRESPLETSGGRANGA